MFTKKLALSLFTVPCAVWTYGISDYHQRKKSQKQTERDRRKQLLNGQVIDITPKNGSKLPWSNVTDEQFQSQWSMKPIKIRGRFDFSVQLKVKKMVHNEIMYEIITPFYTHLDDSGNQVAILVNRGVEAKDFIMKNYSLTDQQGYQTISGVFYKGDPQNKYVRNNQPTINNWLNVKPRDLALYQKVPNINEGVDRFMIKQIDIGEVRRMPHPNPPSSEDLLHWQIEPERHQAYSKLFSFFTYLNMICNTALWLYF